MYKESRRELIETVWSVLAVQSARYSRRISATAGLSWILGGTHLPSHLCRVILDTGWYTRLLKRIRIGSRVIQKEVWGFAIIVPTWSNAANGRAQNIHQHKRGRIHGDTGMVVFDEYSGVNWMGLYVELNENNEDCKIYPVDRMTSQSLMRILLLLNVARETSILFGDPITLSSVAGESGNGNSI